MPRCHRLHRCRPATQLSRLVHSQKKLANLRELNEKVLMTSFILRWTWHVKLTAILLVLSSAALTAAPAARIKPVLLYSRYYNAEGESRYLPDGTYSGVLQQMRDDFDVRIHNKPLTSETLTDVKLVLIANPSDKAVGKNPAPSHFSKADVEALTKFVRTGGSLIVMGNQENHNLEIDDTNKLLSHFGIQFTNLYTDVKRIVVPKETPIIGGLAWAYYTGNSLALDKTHAGKPRALVANDLTQKPLSGSRNSPGVLLAVSEPGQGRIVVVTDAGWITDSALKGEGIGGVAIKEHDNWEIFRHLSRWAAGLPELAKPKAAGR